MNILIPFHSISNPPKARQAKKTAQENKNVKRAAPVEILKPHQSRKNNDCTCFASRQ
jgi:hypothetical protein